MSSITSVGAPTAQAAATATTGTDAASQVAALGLPPVGLVQASSANTVNAELASAQWGIDPGLVSGVYGGSAASDGSLFGSADLLPLLSSLSRSTAEQALSLMGIQTPGVGSGSTSTSGTSPASSSTAPSAAQAAAGAADASLNGALIDPLFGKNA